MQRDEIGALEQFVELDLLDAEIGGALRRQEWIVGDHFHLQPERAVGNDRTDISAADHAERLAENLHAHEFVLFPFAGARRSIGFRNLPRQRQHERDRVLGGGDRIAERRIHHDDAARGRRRNVDIVDANAGAADHLQVFGLFEDLRRHLGGRADGETVIVADGGGELFLVLAERGLEIHLDAAILEDLHGGGRQCVGNKNLGHGDNFLKRLDGFAPFRDGRQQPRHAALGSAALASAKAQSSQGVSASMSRRSTVAPHQMRRPGGASR